MKYYQFLIVTYRVWLRERENPKNIMQFATTVYFVESLQDGALRAMIKSSDNEWECFRVDLITIDHFA